MAKDLTVLIADVVERWAQSLVDELHESIRTKDLFASGVLDQSIQPNVEVADTKVLFQLIMADYYEYVDKGRKPGKRPPTKPIFEWIKNSHKGQGILRPFMAQNKIKDSIKGTQSLAYLISRNIGLKGTKPTNFYSDVVTQEKFDQLNEMIAEAISDDPNTIIDEIQP